MSEIRIPRRVLRAVLLLVSALYLVQGIYYARVLIPAQDGTNYLLAGAKAVSGEIGLYDDRLVGNRVPLPFYVLGLSQALAGGPSLRAARVMNIAFGLLTLWLTAGLARRLGGDLAGILAALFLATQGVIVAYYSFEGYLSFAAMCVIVGFFVFSREESPRYRLVGMALIGLLFFVRSNLWPIIPLALAYSLWRAEGLRERVLLLAAVAVPPAVFFAWSPTHLKLLGYVPVFRGFVAPLGYVSALTLEDRETLSAGVQLLGVAKILRRYEFWVLAVALLAGMVLWRIAARKPLRWATRPVVALAGLLASSMVALFVMYPWNYHWIGLYFVPYAPLVAVLLGVSNAGLLADTEPGSRSRRLLILVLVVLMAFPLYYVRNPLLPTGEMLARDPYTAVHRAAEHLRRAVPGQPRVFFYGLNEIYYLSGLPTTYLQQAYMPDHFTKIPIDDRVAHRSGFVTPGEMRFWLTKDAEYAVIDQRLVDAMTPRFGATEKEMFRLLEQHFELIETVSDYPYNTYLVYRRKSATG